MLEETLPATSAPPIPSMPRKIDRPATLEEARAILGEGNVVGAETYEKVRQTYKERYGKDVEFVFSEVPLPTLDQLEAVKAHGSILANYPKTVRIDGDVAEQSISLELFYNLFSAPPLSGKEPLIKFDPNYDFKPQNLQQDVYKGTAPKEYTPGWKIEGPQIEHWHKDPDVVNKTIKEISQSDVNMTTGLPSATEMTMAIMRDSLTGRKGFLDEEGNTKTMIWTGSHGKEKNNVVVVSKTKLHGMAFIDAYPIDKGTTINRTNAYLYPVKTARK